MGRLKVRCDSDMFLTFNYGDIVEFEPIWQEEVINGTPICVPYVLIDNDVSTFRWYFIPEFFTPISSSDATADVVINSGVFCVKINIGDE